QHFYPIANLRGLLRNRKRTHQSSMEYCPNCLNAFSRPDLLEKHTEVCYNFIEAKLKMPVDRMLKFKDERKTLLTPYFIVLDTESILEKTGDSLKKHILSSYGVALVRSHDSEVINYFDYFGPDSAEKLVDSLEECLHYINTHPLNTPMIFSANDEAKHNSINQCTACSTVFGPTV